MTGGLARFAEVAVPLAVHGGFTYSIPDGLRDSLRLGSRVEVEFKSKRTTGFVVGFPLAVAFAVVPRRSLVD